MKLYVGNLPFSCTEDDLREAFSAHGEVTSTAVITDRETGRSRGFGFVEYANDEEGNKAIEAMNGANLDGRTLNVNEARPREDRGGGGGRGFGGGGGGRGGYGGGGGGGGRGDRGGRGGGGWGGDRSERGGRGGGGGWG
ncbi:MAG: RNA-binding protein [Planctomycetota bacterium]